MSIYFEPNARPSDSSVSTMSDSENEEGDSPVNVKEIIKTVSLEAIGISAETSARAAGCPDSGAIFVGNKAKESAEPLIDKSINSSMSVVQFIWNKISGNSGE